MVVESPRSRKRGGHDSNNNSVNASTRSSVLRSHSTGSSSNRATTARGRSTSSDHGTEEHGGATTPEPLTLFAQMNIGMDHVLADTPRPTPIPASLRLRNHEMERITMWRALGKIVTNRKEAWHKRKGHGRGNTDHGGGGRQGKDDDRARKREREERRRKKDKRRDTAREEKTPEEPRREMTMQQHRQREAEGPSVKLETSKKEKKKSKSKKHIEKHQQKQEQRATSRRGEEDEGEEEDDDANGSSSLSRARPRSRSRPHAWSHQPVASVVKVLDLSGANHSAVVSHSVEPSPRSASIPASAHSSPVVSAQEKLLRKLRALPLLERLEADTAKFRAIQRWMDVDDGNNTNMTEELRAAVITMERKGVFDRHRRGEMDPSRVASVAASKKVLNSRAIESLDEQLRMEERLRRGKRGRRRANGTSGSTTRGLRVSSRRQRESLGGFVVTNEDDDDEDGEAEWGVDADADEQEYDDSSSDSNNSNSNSEEAEVDRQPRGLTTATRRSSHRGSPPPPSSSSQPAVVAQQRRELPALQAEKKKSSHGTPTSKEWSATEQLALVAARLRREENGHGSADDDTPTSKYLSYSAPTPPSNTKSKTRKDKKQPPQQQQKRKRKHTEQKRSRGADGLSESSAIVLEDSDSDSEDNNDEDQGPERLTIVTTNGIHAQANMKVDANGVGDGNHKEEEDEDSSTDEDHDMFDLAEEDVFVVESILAMKAGRTLVAHGRRSKEADLFLVKWEGYDELTWEPDANIPKRLIQFYRNRELAMRECGYQIDHFTQRKVAKNSTTGRDEVIYYIQWAGMERGFWESRSNLPEKTVIWLEKTYRAGGTGGASGGGPSRKKIKR